MGFEVDFEFISIDQSGTNIALVDPGSEVTLRVAGHAHDHSSSGCDGCVTQFYVLSHPADVDKLDVSICLGSSTGSHHFDETVTFYAPAQEVIFLNCALRCCAALIMTIH